MEGGRAMQIIEYRDPWRALQTLRSEIDSLFEGSLEIFPKMEMDIMTPSVDVWEDNENVYVESDLPGFEKKDIEVNLKNEFLTISANKEQEKEEKKKEYYRSERYRGKFYRELDLPSSVDPDQVKVNFKDGVLKITMRKKPEEKSKKIKVNIE
jgi:HSP20 family protein